MRDKDRELLILRQKTLALHDKLVPITQFSWRIKKTKDTYNLDTKDIEELQFFYAEMYHIYIEFCEYLKTNPLSEKEVRNEN